MPNYNLVVTSRYKPYTFDEMAKPFLLYKAEYDKQAEKVETMGLEAAKRLKFLDPVLDKDTYDEYAKSIQDIDDLGKDLLENGLNANNLDRARAVRNNLQAITTPLDYALQQREKEKELYTKMKLEHPDVYISRDPFSTPISSYYPGSGLSSFSVINSGDLYKNALLKAASFAKQFSKGDMRRLNNLYYEYVHTVGLQGNPEEIMKDPKYRAFAEMQAALEKSVDMSQFSPGQQEEIKKKILMGIQDGIVSSYEEKGRKPVVDQMALLKLKNQASLDLAREKARLGSTGSSRKSGSGSGTQNAKPTVPTLPYNTKPISYDRSNYKSVEATVNDIKKKYTPDKNGVITFDTTGFDPYVISGSTNKNISDENAYYTQSAGGTITQTGQLQLYEPVTKKTWEPQQTGFVNGELRSLKPNYTEEVVDQKLLNRDDFIEKNLIRYLENSTHKSVNKETKEEIRRAIKGESEVSRDIQDGVESLGRKYDKILKDINKSTDAFYKKEDGTLDTKTLKQITEVLPDENSSKKIKEQVLRIPIKNVDATVKHIVEQFFDENEEDDNANFGLRKISGGTTRDGKTVVYDYESSSQKDYDDFYEKKTNGQRGDFKTGWEANFSTRSGEPALVFTRGSSLYSIPLSAFGNSHASRVLNPAFMQKYNELEEKYANWEPYLSAEEMQECKICMYALSSDLYSEEEKKQAYAFLNSNVPGKNITYKKAAAIQEQHEKDDDDFLKAQSTIQREINGLLGSYIKPVEHASQPTKKERDALQGNVDENPYDYDDYLEDAEEEEDLDLDFDY